MGFDRLKYGLECCRNDFWKLGMAFEPSLYLSWLVSSLPPLVVVIKEGDVESDSNKKSLLRGIFCCIDIN